MKGNIDLRIAVDLLRLADKIHFDCYTHILRAIDATDLDDRSKEHYVKTASLIMAGLTDYIDELESKIIEHYADKEQTNE